MNGPMIEKDAIARQIESVAAIADGLAAEALHPVLESLKSQEWRGDWTGLRRSLDMLTPTLQAASKDAAEHLARVRVDLSPDLIALISGASGGAAAPKPSGPSAHARPSLRPRRARGRPRLAMTRDQLARLLAPAFQQATCSTPTQEAVAEALDVSVATLRRWHTALGLPWAHVAELMSGSAELMSGLCAVQRLADVSPLGQEDNDAAAYTHLRCALRQAR